MTMTRRLMRGAMVVAGAIGAVAAATPDRGIGRWARTASARLARDARYVAAATPGLTYRLRGAHPDPDADDDVVAARVRARLGLITAHLGIPPVTVHVIDHVAILEGGVPRLRDALRIERGAFGVSGVRGVESHLHEDDTVEHGRTDADAMPSIALVELCEVAGAAGARDERAAVHAVLCAFADRLSDSARFELAWHLPPDVRSLLEMPRRYGERLRPARTVTELVATVIGTEGEGVAVATEDAYAVTAAVVGRLHDLVPEATADVIAALPHEVAGLWVGSAGVRS